MWVWLARILLGALAAALPSLIGRILLALGIGYTTYTGLNAGTDYLYQHIQNSFSGMPAAIVGFLAFCWIDKGISLVASAFTVSLAIKTLQTLSVTKMVLKKPS